MLHKMSCVQSLEHEELLLHSAGKVWVRALAPSRDTAVKPTIFIPVKLWWDGEKCSVIILFYEFKTAENQELVDAHEPFSDMAGFIDVSFTLLTRQDIYRKRNEKCLRDICQWFHKRECVAAENSGELKSNNMKKEECLPVSASLMDFKTCLNVFLTLKLG